ncbi:MAG: YlxR family protein [Oscillospiraceae bacterium]|jgi:predicted RNA-binding protein YlxR (DUF448 family)|nr:YlxR family protein [Oscillospiraceae bacterium]
MAGTPKKESAAAEGGKKVPMRMCVSCREMKPKAQLARIVKTPQGAVVLDKTGRTNGRGAYICNDGKCLAKARKARMLDRALGVPVPAELFDEL